MGCPVHKVTRSGGGSALLCDAGKTIALVRHIVEAVRLPVTVKMRLGWDDKSLSAPFFAREFEQAGVAAVTLLLLVQAVVPDAWRLTVLGLAAGAFGVFAALGLLYSALRPKGTLHADRSNQRWIVLHDVHPSFVAAVEAIEAARPHSGAAKSR